MNRSLLCALAVASLGAMTGCGAEAGQQEAVDESGNPIVYDTYAAPTLTLTSLASKYPDLIRNPPPPKGDFLGRDDPSKRGTFNPLDGHLAGLAWATVKCKGSLDPDDYDAYGDIMKPRFDKCPLDEKQYEHINNLLGVQLINKEAAAYFKRLRLEAQKGFPREDIPKCPEWKLVQSINGPSFESVKEHKPGVPAKENGIFAVSSEVCKDSKECAVAHAQRCSAGLGSQWWIKGDYGSGLALTDPAWWLETTVYPDAASNPFMTPGYFHAMSYYGAAPGAIYGSVYREGEYCSKYYAGAHLRLKLQPVWCTPTWKCVSECR